MNVGEAKSMIAGEAKSMNVARGTDDIRLSSPELRY